MIATPYPKRMTVEEYLIWEPLQTIRHEYLNGDVFAMTWLLEIIIKQRELQQLPH